MNQLKTHLERLGRYINAARWLRVSQMFWFVVRRVMPPSIPAQPDIEPVRSPLSTQAYPRVVQPADRMFEFIGVRRSPDLPVDWHPADVPRLWRYNLHYFDFLLWDAFDDELKACLIDDWIAANPPGAEDAWEPYTVSLRIVNWIKFIDRRESETPATWLGSLIHQAVWLNANLEYHILANHFLKNAKALLYAGAFFDGPTGRRLLRKGARLFDQEVSEQLLADGGHYERSVMYHGIVLEDLLDVLNLASSRPDMLDTGFVERVGSQARLAARFLDDIVGGDGRIPLFNDAALGIAPEPEELLAYAERVVGYQRAPRPPVPVKLEKPDTGYFGYRHGNESLIVDCGAIAPDYQPGHAHCDLLSFELCLDGERVIVDTGTFGYEVGERRHYLRSTAAHNTVEVDGVDQSEMWGGFRVSRRARPVAPALTEFSAEGLTFCGAHNGYRRLDASVLHHREIRVRFAGDWTVADTLEGRGQCAARSFLHFAPGIALRQDGSGAWIAASQGADLLRIIPTENCSAESRATEYYPCFGQVHERTSLVMAAGGDLPLSLGYRIERLARRD